MSEASSPQPGTSSDPSFSGRKISPIVALPILLAALAAGAWLGVGGARVAVTSSSLATHAVLEPEALYDLGMKALVLDISNSDFVGRLNQGPLQVRQDMVTRILHTTYDTVETAAKAREVHGALLQFIRHFPEQEIFRVSIAEERPVLADSLGRVLLDQYGALSDCGLGDDVSSLASATRLRLFGGSGEEFFNDQHPDCRPPDVVAERVEEGLREEIAEMSASGPDSVDTFPDQAGDVEFAELVDQIRRQLLWTHPAWPVGLLIAALAGYALAHPRHKFGLPVALFGVGLMLYGVVALVLAPDRIRVAFRGTGTEGEASEIWGQLGSYAFQRTSVLSGTWAVLAGGSLVLGVVLFGIMSRRRTEH